MADAMVCDLMKAPCPWGGGLDCQYVYHVYDFFMLHQKLWSKHLPVRGEYYANEHATWKNLPVEIPYRGTIFKVGLWGGLYCTHFHTPTTCEGPYFFIFSQMMYFFILIFDNFVAIWPIWEIFMGDMAEMQ